MSSYLVHNQVVMYSILPAGIMQWCVTILVGRVGIGVYFFQEILHNLCMSIPMRGEYRVVDDTITDGLLIRVGIV